MKLACKFTPGLEETATIMYLREETGVCSESFIIYCIYKLVLHNVVLLYIK